MKLPPGFIGELFRAVAAGGTRVAATGASLFKKTLALIKSGDIPSLLVPLVPFHHIDNILPLSFL
jgi:hypothetical protein